MGEKTGIAWTDHTFNPWIGCAKVAPECAHCYAEGYGQRFGVAWGPQGTRRRTSESNWKEPLRWDRAARRDGVRRRVFCASLADVFEDRADLLTWRRDLFALIDRCHNLDWLLLTKRPENVHDMVPAWPRNAWLGASAGTNATLTRALPDLIDVPGPRVRFLSAEPLLERIHIPYLGEPRVIDWVIVGGESGPRARPCSVEWIRSIVRQCKSAGVPVFVKQIRLADGILRHDPREWPGDLRVREWPR